jgi:peptidyl-prolyl cis-trans isomerase SurA
MRGWLAVAVVLALLGGAGTFAQTSASPDTAEKFVDLDHVVAVINGEVLLESDVEEEMHFAALEPFQPHAGRDTRQDALRRLTSRVLIVQQMRQQNQFNVKVSGADVEKSLKELRTHLPQCLKYKCETDAGWKAFLKANDLTNAEVVDHWKKRLTILDFINVRFRAGIRTSHQDVEDYYNKSVVPEFTRQHQTAPPLKDVSSRIQEVLLQQQVNGLLRDWLQSLREEGNVQIVDLSYATVENASKPAEED